MVITISGASDIIDGKIARKFNMVSDVGKVLDPVADKLTQAALVICLIARYTWMWALLALFAVKECLMLLWGYLTLKSTDTINGAKWYGKLSTVVLYAVMMILILFVDTKQRKKPVPTAISAEDLITLLERNERLIVLKKFFHRFI